MQIVNGLFTSEAVSKGHPDKICDQISDAILDAFLSLDPHARVACETMVADQRVFVVGEFKTKNNKDFTQVEQAAESIVRHTLKKIGYGSCATDIDPDTCSINIHFNHQSEQISAGVDRKDHILGAGDQGIMFGFACLEAEDLMPLAWHLATKLIVETERWAQETGFPLKPDAKSQVTVLYENGEPKCIENAVLSWQHDSSVDLNTVRKRLEHEVIDRVIPPFMRSASFKAFVNYAGAWTIGGPKGDTGLTGRKIIVDTYGGSCPHGGGAFSGKDPSKVDRTGAYMARYIAKHIVQSQLARQCTIQLSYIIGKDQPASVIVDTHGTSMIQDQIISQAVMEIFDLSPAGMIKELDLLRPIYQKTASLGHFGFARDPHIYLWESTPRIQELVESVGLNLKRRISY